MSSKPQDFELSYEFFPPRTESGREKLAATRADLEQCHPGFFSVTFGAGGSTRDKTLETVVDIQQNSPVEACPHMTCVGASIDEIVELLEIYRQNGISRVLALRGDQPSGMIGAGDLRHANELLELIQKRFGDHFTLHVAAYPEAHPDSKNMRNEVNHFVNKMNSGAHSAITQYFFNTDSYFHFVDLCAAKGIDKPIIPGIMPISNFDSLKRFSKTCGADIPRWIRKSMASWDDDADGQRKMGVEIVTGLCAKLIDQGAPGLHFYTMNQSGLTRQILHNLELLD
jgi:methylenetetrahydrofolate reductase (NADPH)